MVATTLEAVVVAEPVLVELSKVRVSAKTAYQIAKTLRLVKAETAHYEEQRRAHIVELGTEDPAAQLTTVNPENWPEFAKRMTDLNALAVDIDIAPLSLESFELLTAADVLALGPFLVP